MGAGINWGAGAKYFDIVTKVGTNHQVVCEEWNQGLTGHDIAA